MESVYIGCLGALGGILLGGAFALAMQVRGLDMASLLPRGVAISGFAMSTTVHARLTLPILCWTAGFVLFSTLFLTLAPIRRVRRVRLAQTLR
jgi:ABC-type lipoprotein release transport system permease subunit